MPLFIVILVLQVGLLVHAIKTGRNTLWIWVLLGAPLVGGLAYVIVELLPSLGRNQTLRRANEKVSRKLDPSRGMREAAQQLKRQETHENLVRMARECEAAGLYADAEMYLERGLKGQYRYDPQLLEAIARVQLTDQRPAACRQTLDALIEHNPDYRSLTGHECYADALFALEDWAAAEEEYRALTGYSATARVKYRLGLCLEKRGDKPGARAIWQQLLEGDNATPHRRHARAGLD